MFDVEAALRELIAKQGSDLHLKVGNRPLFRVDGNLAAEQDGPVLSAEDTEHALEVLLTRIPSWTNSHSSMRSTSPSKSPTSPATA